jgi:hypothetical protein
LEQLVNRTAEALKVFMPRSRDKNCFIPGGMYSFGFACFGEAPGIVLLVFHSGETHVFCFGGYREKELL